MESKADVDEKLFRRDFMAVCTSNLLAFFSIYMIVPVLPLFLEEKGYSNALIGALMAMLTVAALLRPLFGRAADRRGRKLVVFLGTMFLGVSTYLYAAFGSALPLFFVRFVNGLGLAAFHTAAYAMIGDLAPSSRRLQAIAIFYMSVDLAIATAPWAGLAIEEAWGFTHVYIIAASLAVLAMFASLALRETGTRGVQKEKGKRTRIRLTVLQKAIFVNTMCFTLTLGTLQAFIILSSEAKGIDLGQFFFTIFAATLIVFRVGVGRRADRWPRRPLIVASACATLAGLVIIALASSIAILFTGTFVYALGFAYLPTTLSALLLDHTPESDRGAALGIFMAVFDVGIGLGSLALGPLADLWNYTTMYLACAAIGLAGLLFFLFLTARSRCGEGA